MCHSNCSSYDARGELGMMWYYNKIPAYMRRDLLTI